MLIRHSHLLVLLAVNLVFAQAVPESTESDSGEQANANEATQPAVYTVIEGQVVDELGQGIEDAIIKALKVGDEAIHGEARSDHYGDFRIPLPGEHPGIFKITFEKDSFTPKEIEFEIFEDDLEPFVDAVLSGSLTIAGEVVEFLENLPVVGAKVELRADYRSSTSHTDEAGRFEFKNLMPGPAELNVSAEGFGKSKIRALISTNAGLIRIVLKPEKILRLLVVDEEEKPVAEASVEIEIESADDYRSSTTDAAGQVTIKQLPYDVQTVKVRLTHGDFVASGRFDRDVHLSEDTFETQATLRLMPAAKIKGRVFEAASDRPLNGARIDVGAALEGFTPYTFTNLSGEFNIGSLPPGKTVVTAHVSGFAPALQEVATSPRETISLDFALAKGRTISGVVQDSEGHPIKRADVEAITWQTYHTLGLSDRTDEQGRFIIEHAPTDEFSVTISARGYARLSGQRITAERNNYEFKLDAGVTSGSDELFRGAIIKKSDTFPPFKLTTLDGKLLDQNSIKGKLALIEFWATWCGPCVQEIPTIKRIHEAFGKRDDFLIIGISRDFDKRMLQEFIRSNEITWHQVYASGSGGDELADALGVRAIPFNVLIGADGKIVTISLVGDALFNKIDELLQVKKHPLDQVRD